MLTDKAHLLKVGMENNIYGREEKDLPVFAAEQLVRLATEILVAAGAPAEEARLVSEFLVKANLAGHDSHGVIRIAQYTGDRARRH